MAIPSVLPACAFCGGNKSCVIQYGQFPMAPRATKEIAVRTFDFAVGTCDSCGLIQLMHPADPSVLYEEFKNDVIGEKLAKHRMAFKEFLKLHIKKDDKLFEIGAGDGTLATLLHDSFDRRVDITINDINNINRVRSDFYCVDGCFETAIVRRKYDVIYSSLVFEHICNYDEHLRKVRTILRAGGKFIMSVPNIEAWLERQFLNTFSQEHTIYAFKEDVCDLLSRYGFVLQSSSDYSDYSIFLCFTRDNDENVGAGHNGKVMIERKNTLLANYHRFLQALAGFINDQAKGRTLHIFGANSSAQILLRMLSDENRRRVRFIFDNSPLKQEKYLYGFNLTIKSPTMVKLLGSNDAVLVFMGAFDSEIILQLRSYNDQVIIISRRDFDERNPVETSKRTES
ncbi:methyltransferase domain-containing protein [Candidatus Methylomirabilis sp.]|uniref:methyltransferase domain-containing protein n=1 Tax=Candidatus Methylomirabilis sp. TaxID=2032687 RepID=UPI002A64F50C|nr:methyltransferase domain-containing protein [Candidatus Methylomirabilis sp.]